MRTQVVAMDGNGFLNWVGGFFNLGLIAVIWHGLLPFFIVVLPSIYFVLMIWEMRTTQHFVRNWRTKRLASRYAKAQADAKKAMAKLDAIAVLTRAKHEARALVEDAETEAAKLVVKQEASVKSNLPPV